MSEAAVCVEGLTNMQSYYGAQLAQSPESSVPWGDAFHFLMAVMLEWRKRVVDGRMPHGALLAHARLKGTTMADEHGAVVPASGYDWQDHGRDGVAAVKSILLNLGFYPKIVMQVASLTPPAVPTQAMRNIAKKEQAFPSVDWSRVTLIRGVELWMGDAQVLEENTWEVLQGGPKVSDLQRPVHSGHLRPGEFKKHLLPSSEGALVFGPCTGTRRRTNSW